MNQSKVMRLLYYSFILFIAFSCTGKERLAVINIYLYDHSPTPKNDYDALYLQLISSPSVDSVKIFGCPLYEKKVVIKVDTVKAEHYNISREQLKTEFKELIGSADSDTMMFQSIISSSKEKIPITAFTTFQLSQKAYKPTIYIPLPTEVYYNKRKAVHLQVFYSKRDKKKLIEFINESFDGSDYTLHVK